ncbi:DHBP synthase RibB-like alpha/beta domain-containing protein [Dioszegia hungarica]|uniref:Threonylcarbamoyl-AMP synthase n=1 Tax=Dioszegia hungarica TaxID=4972 RepID=A0AA38LXV8_9TREE|nr:DHBP synthase RibB-like alpha/beta domain-containing protein [Dioszegia hungarica]KAI9637921.1 DHBP synthase RibB-like alpha/beta domain-containing protein [Dioszegia hungarica]
MPSTPVLPCLPSSSAPIVRTPGPAGTYPLQRPTYTIPPSLFPHIQTASDHLRSGRTVALPTETVYGLAASSLNPSALQLIYKIKNRPSDNPLIIHISSLDMLQSLLPTHAQPSALYMALITAFWPGPLTLLFPSKSPPPLPAPQTNAIRMPNHPLTLAVINHADLPLSAPSANSSGRPSPTRARDVVRDLDGAEGLGCILDGGDCGVGVESTVVDGLAWKEGGGGYVDVLRPGGLGVEEIKRVVEEVDGKEGMTEIRVHGKPWRGPAKASAVGYTKPTATASQTKEARSVERSSSEASSSKLFPSTPGMKYRHYSPRVPVYLLLPSNSFPRPSTTAASSPSDPSSVLRSLASRHPSPKPRFGLLHYTSSPLFHSLSSDSTGSSVPEATYDLTLIPLGPDSTSAAQRLFSGLLDLEGGEAGLGGVDAILVEGCTDEGLGLAVMERVGKAVGGGGAVGALGVGEGSGGEEGRFWVQV